MGLSHDLTGNAVTPSTMPFIFNMMARHGFARLSASGKAVGLREGMVGNSEVGHLTIGAGTVVPSSLGRLDAAYRDGSWLHHHLWPEIVSAERCHIVGLLSDAGVHGHWDNLWRSAELASRNGCPEVVVHPVLDGVDSPARSASMLLERLTHRLASLPRVHLGMICGRRWFSDRSSSSNLAEAFTSAFMSLEELPPFAPDGLSDVENESDFPAHRMPGSLAALPSQPVILTSHRSDRAIQVAKVLSHTYRVYAPIALSGVIPKERAFFPAEPLKQGVAQELARLGLKTTRIAEECKFPHVTTFFNGLNEDVPARHVSIPTFAEIDLPRHPEMAVKKVMKACVEEIEAGSSDLVVVNMANLDQIGHLGRLDLASKAARKVDAAAQHLCERAYKRGWNTLFVSDHGNADCVETADGQPFGSHTDRPVPMIVGPAPGTRGIWIKRDGSLANIAATVMTSLGLRLPAYMAPPLIEFCTD